MDTQQILQLALELGDETAQTRQEALTALCSAAAAAVEAKLLSQADASADAVLAGTAYLALSWLPQPDAREFTAGEISVRRGAADGRSAYYGALAARLLAPYTKATDFAFLGVDG